MHSLIADMILDLVFQDRALANYIGVLMGRMMHNTSRQGEGVTLNQAKLGCCTEVYDAHAHRESRYWPGVKRIRWERKRERDLFSPNVRAAETNWLHRFSRCTIRKHKQRLKLNKLALDLTEVLIVRLWHIMRTESEVGYTLIFKIEWFASAAGVHTASDRHAKLPDS